MTIPTVTEDCDVVGLPKFGIQKEIDENATNAPAVNVIVSTSFKILAYPAAWVAGEVKTKGVPGEQLENPNRVTIIFASDGIDADGVNETVRADACEPKIMLDRDKMTLEKYALLLTAAMRYPDELFAIIAPELVGDMKDCKFVTSGVAPPLKNTPSVSKRLPYDNTNEVFALIAVLSVSFHGLAQAFK